MGRSILVGGLFCLVAVLGQPECWGQTGAQPGQVLIIHPGIYHIWFDEEPSREVIDRFTQIFNAGKTAEHRQPARVIRATSLFKDPTTGQYEEKPVWLVNFHWDRMIQGAAEHGIPVYVTVEDGISMYEAEPGLRPGLLRRGMSEEAETQVKNQAFSGGTHGSKVNEQRILDVHLGVIEKHPDAVVQTFVHSQSGDNFFGFLKSTDRKTRRRIAQHLGTVCLWDPALAAPLAELVAHLPLAERGHKLLKDRPLTAGEHELTRTDPPDEKGQHYLDRVNAEDPELARDLEGVNVIFGGAQGTVSQLAIRRLAQQLGAEYHDPKKMGELAGKSGVTRVTTRDGNPVVDRSGNPLNGQPWVLAVKDHNLDYMNDFIAEKVLGIEAPEKRPNASKFNPAYASQYFRNCVIADMGGAILASDGEVDGSTARADRLENIPVWDGAQGTPDFIASQAMQAMHGSAKGTVVIDPAGNEELARQVGGIIESRGGRVVYAEGLEDAVSQTVAGRQMTAAVLRLAEKQEAGDTTDAATLERSLERGGSSVAQKSGIRVRLEMSPESLVAFPSSPQEALQMNQLLGERRRRELESAKTKRLAGVSVYAGSIPLAADPLKEEGWTMNRVGGSNWFEVQHESWDSSESELVLDGSDMTSGQIVDAVKQKLNEIDDQDDEEGKDGEKSGKRRKVVVGGDPDDPKVREVIEGLSQTDEDGDGEPDIEIVFVNCKGMSRRQAIRAVARAVRRHGAALGVAIAYMPRKRKRHTPNDEPPARLFLPNPIWLPKPVFPNPILPPPVPLLVPGLAAHAVESDDPTGARLAKLREEIAQSARQPHLLDRIRELRAAEAEPSVEEPAEDWDDLRFEQAQLLVRVREIEQDHVRLLFALDELVRRPEEASDQAERQARLSQIEQQHTRLKSWLDWSARQADLSVHPSSLGDQLRELKQRYEEVRQSLQQVAAGPATHELLDDLRGRMARLHRTHDSLRESLVDNLEWINPRIRQVALNQQVRDLHRELATAQASLPGGPVSRVSPTLPGRIESLQRNLAALQDALMPHPAGFQPTLPPERMRDLHAGVSRLQESLRGGQGSLSSTAFEGNLYRLEQLAAKTQAVIRRNQLAADPVALHDRLADLAGSFRRTQELLKQQTSRIAPTHLERDLASLSGNVARINQALRRNAVGIHAPLLRDDLRQLQHQLLQSRTFLGRSPVRITPAAFQTHATGLNDMMTRTRASLVKAQSAIRPLAVEHGLIGFRTEVVSMQRLLRREPSQITPSAFQQQAVRLENRLAALNTSLKLAAPEVPTASLQSRLSQLTGELAETRQLVKPSLARLEPATFEGPLNKLSSRLTDLSDPLKQTRLAVQPLAMQSRVLDLEDNLTHVQRTLNNDFSSTQAEGLQQKMEVLRSRTAQMRTLASHDLTKMQRPELQQHFSQLQQNMLRMRQDLRSIGSAHKSLSGQAYLRSVDDSFRNMAGTLGGISPIETPGFSLHRFDTPHVRRLTPKLGGTTLGGIQKPGGNLSIKPGSSPLQQLAPLPSSYITPQSIRHDFQRSNFQRPQIPHIQRPQIQRIQPQVMPRIQTPVIRPSFSRPGFP